MDLLAGIFILLSVVFVWLMVKSKTHQKRMPLSVNYHFSRHCNYECGFCFHTYTNDFKLPLKEAKRGLMLLKEAGMRKINFAGIIFIF